MTVHDRGEIAPLTAYLEVGHVGDPDLIYACRLDGRGLALDAGQEPGETGPTAIKELTAAHHDPFAENHPSDTQACLTPELSRPAKRVRLE